MTLEQAIQTLKTLLPNSKCISTDELEDAINDLLQIPEYSMIDKNTLIKKMDIIYDIYYNLERA